MSGSISAKPAPARIFRSAHLSGERRCGQVARKHFGVSEAECWSTSHIGTTCTDGRARFEALSECAVILPEVALPRDDIPSKWSASEAAGHLASGRDQSEYASFVDVWLRVYNEVESAIVLEDLSDCPYKVRALDRLLWYLGQDGFYDQSDDSSAA